MMIKNLAKKIAFRLAILSLCVIGGFPMASWAMEENQFYLLGENERSSTAVKLNTVTSEFKNLTSFWDVEWSALENAYKIVRFPAQNQITNDDILVRDYKHYRPEFTGTLDTLILTLSDKPDFLDDPWTARALSCHGIMAESGLLIIHADAFKNEKGKLAGKWNDRALGIVCLHQAGDKNFSIEQQDSLKKYLGVLHEKSKNVRIAYGGSMWQAKQIEGFEESAYIDGKVENIQQVLNNLGLTPLRDFYETVDDICNKK